MNKLTEAIRLAALAHDGQVDKIGQPYILHPLRVMLSLDEETDRIVGVLHDVVEDSDVAGHDDILDQFGPEVHEAVYALTRQEGEDYETFVLRCRVHPIARRVKLADIADNMRPGAKHLREKYERARALLARDGEPQG